MPDGAGVSAAAGVAVPSGMGVAVPAESEGVPVAAGGAAVGLAVVPPPPEHPASRSATPSDTTSRFIIRQTSQPPPCPLPAKENIWTKMGVAIAHRLCYLNAATGYSSAWLECLLREQEVPSSNLGTPKIFPRTGSHLAPCFAFTSIRALFVIPSSIFSTAPQVFRPLARM